MSMHCSYLLEIVFQIFSMERFSSASMTTMSNFHLLLKTSMLCLWWHLQFASSSRLEQLQFAISGSLSLPLPIIISICLFWHSLFASSGNLSLSLLAIIYICLFWQSQFASLPLPAITFCLFWQSLICLFWQLLFCLFLQLLFCLFWQLLFFSSCRFYFASWQLLFCLFWQLLFCLFWKLLLFSSCSFYFASSSSFYFSLLAASICFLQQVLFCLLQHLLFAFSGSLSLPLPVISVHIDLLAMNILAINNTVYFRIYKFD